MKLSLDIVKLSEKFKAILEVYLREVFLEMLFLRVLAFLFFINGLIKTYFIQRIITLTNPISPIYKVLQSFLSDNKITRSTQIY